MIISGLSIWDYLLSYFLSYLLSYLFCHFQLDISIAIKGYSCLGARAGLLGSVPAAELSPALLALAPVSAQG